MVRSRDALAESRRARRRGRWLKRSAIVLAVILLVVVIILGLNHPRFSIRNVAITGTEIVSPEELLIAIEKKLNAKWFGAISKKNVWFYPRRALAQVLVAKVPRVGMVEVSKTSPDSIRIDIKERKAAIVICDVDQCFLADESGFIFELAPQFSYPAIPLIRVDGRPLAVGSRPVPAQEISRLLDLGRELGQILAESVIGGEAVVEIDVLAHRDYRLWIGSWRFGGPKWPVLVSGDHNFLELGRNLRLALAAPDFKAAATKNSFNLDYFDLRFDNKVFYKFKEVAPDQNV